MIGEPGRTNYDLNFRFMGYRVRVHPGFWILIAVISFRPGMKPLDLLIFTAAAFTSILIHELGHAFAYKRYRINSHIVLYHMGGVAVADSVEAMAGIGKHSQPGKKIFISFAGPILQMLFAVLVIVACRAATKSDGFVSAYLPASASADPLGAIPKMLKLPIARSSADDPQNSENETIENTFPESTARSEYKYFLPSDVDQLDGLYARILKNAQPNSFGRITVRELIDSVRIEHPALAHFVYSFVMISLFWGVLNLLPIYPLDGGQISRELFLLSGARDAVGKSMMFSIAVAIIGAMYWFKQDVTFNGLLFLMLAMSNYQMLNAYKGRRF